MKKMDLTVKVILCVLFFIFGILRFQMSEPLTDFTYLASYNNFGNVKIRGFISEEPDLRLSHTKITVEASMIFTSGAWRNVSGRVLASISRFPEFEYRDEVELRGKLMTPENMDDFSYEDYLSLFDVYSVMYTPHVTLLGKRPGFDLRAPIFKLKKVLTRRLNLIFPEPYASFAAGLLTGARKGMQPKILENFRTTGLTHIIAVSGYNITILILFVGGLFAGAEPKTRIMLSTAVILLFMILTSMSASVVRASIMGILSLASLWFGRKDNVIHILLITAFAMAMANPRIVVFDKGFQLSYAATFGLVLLSPKLESFFKKVPEILGLRTALTATISAQIATLPIILNSFGRWSLVAPLSNIFVLPLIPLAMLCAALALALSFIFFPLGLLVGWWGKVVLGTVIMLSDTFAKIPFASVEVSGFSWFMAILAYCLILGLLKLYRRPPQAPVGTADGCVFPIS